MNLIELSIKRPIFILMVTLFFIVIGGLSLKKLPVDLYPDVSYPVLAVRANLAGAAPEEMEQLVTKPLEDALSSLGGLTTIRSTSREGLSAISLEFEAGVDIKFQETQVRAKVANLRRSLPEDLSEPVVNRQDPDAIPIIELSVTGNRTTYELNQLAEDTISERIRQIPGVGEVELSGGRQKEVVVDLKPLSLEAHGLSAGTIIQAIKDFNGSDPIGSLKGNRMVWLLRSTSPIKGISDLRSIPVTKSQEGEPVLLGDIAEISEGFAKVNRIGRLHDGKKLQPAITLEVIKQSGENTVGVSDQVQELVKELQSELPKDISILVTRDNADLVRTNVADVLETLVIGALLTIAVVLLFLRSPRATLTTGISLPSSVITTFAIMAAAGFTINIMTLLALSLAIGLLVDDAIVVRENIFRHLSSPAKMSPAQASLLGTKEVALAVVATTLTIVAVFLPVGFMGGTTGQFFKQFAVTVVFAIMVSLWDALTMAPMLSTYFANIADPAREWQFMGRAGAVINDYLERFEHSFGYLERAYKNLLLWILPRPWVAGLTAAVSLGLAILGFMVIGKSFVPTQLGNVFSVSLNGPLALPIEEVDKTGLLVNERIKAVEGLEFWTIRAGTGFSGNANINLTLRVKKDRGKNQEALAKIRTDVRSALKGIVGYTVRVSEPADPLAGSSGRFQQVGVLISGHDIKTLRQLARTVLAIMNGIEGMTDVSPLQEEGLPALMVRVNPKLAGHFGITGKSLSEELRIWIEGDSSNSMQLGEDRIPIRVRLHNGEKLTSGGLMAKSLFSRHSQGGGTLAIPIGSTVNLEAGAGPAVISRENRQKILRVGGNTERGIPLGGIVRNLEQKLKELPLPDGYKVRIVGQNEQMDELFSNIGVALALGCLFMYMILASLFESFIQPLTVMAAVPLAATGAVVALLLFGMPLDLYGGIGIILLAGIVAKNSILLVDFAMQRVREGSLPPDEAIVQSAPLRLRPILMTSIAMIVGMLPVATGWGVGGAARQSLGIATIGGIFSSTLLTLLIVPNLYIFIERWSKRPKK